MWGILIEDLEMPLAIPITRGGGVGNQPDFTGKSGDPPGLNSRPPIHNLFIELGQSSGDYGEKKSSAIKRKAHLGADHGALCNTRRALYQKPGLSAIFLEAHATNHPSILVDSGSVIRLKILILFDSRLKILKVEILVEWWTISIEQLSCGKCPEHVCQQMKDFMLKKAKAKQAYDPLVDGYDLDNEEDEECVVTKACREIGKWFYDAGIPFHAATYDSFQIMLEVVAQFGPGFQAPSMHELRVPLLTTEVEETKTEMESHKKEWAIKGCSILSDGWRDCTGQKDIFNFLVNSPKGSVFVKSMDVSKITKDAHQLLAMLEEMVDEIGEENVVKVATDNASNYKLAGNL
ncbi:hypothetical protein E3N88_10069 [Mikania micrantha]|uniref:DUF659 domain-containing protein n=1 Tax=Mikania micrantha TaxID=192012 RepID=A0A5N6PAN8_9ASTR|nr:hypothetical protein E3N88_10069 [Mikania micrantha]